ncbi:uncharacterized protein LOC129569315 [Sitodiplosis mosellana]|uniref:uncharacterized protein LOC129569315 n=1 Tax=Sitodiplosis mosellana TaxID=263140 RepID=UPI0024446B4C|nr:uncharacterized protein LOC129569315 [Sitodiplosis mosellana]
MGKVLLKWIIKNLNIILPSIYTMYFGGLIVLFAEVELMTASVFFSHIFTLYLLVFKIDDFRNKYKAYIGLFLLCESTLSINMLIIVKNLPIFEEDLLSFIANSLLIFSLVSYMGMNIFNHLLLIYWEIYEIEEKSLWTTAVMRAAMRVLFPITISAVNIFSISIPVRFFNMVPVLFLLPINVILDRFLSMGKETLIKSKIISVVQKHWPNPFRITVFCSILASVLIWCRRGSPGNDKFCFDSKIFISLGIFFVVSIAQDYFLKFHMDYSDDFPMFIKNYIEESDDEDEEEIDDEVNNIDSDDEDLEFPSILVLDYAEPIKTR